MKVFCDLRSLLTADLTPGERVMIGGELQFVSLGDTLPDLDDHVAQPPRPGNFKLLGESTPIQVALSDAVFPLIQANPKVRFSLSVDWYIDYLRKRGQDVVLIGGAQTDTGTNLEIFVVQKGRVTLVIDKNMPMIGSSRFDGELSVALDDVARRLNLETLPKIAWAYPLPDYDGSRYGGFEYVGAERFAKVVQQPIRSDGKGPSVVKGLVAPLALAGLGLLAGAGMVYLEWNRYQSLKASFEREIVGLETVYEDGAGRLELLNKRQMLLDTPAPQTVLLARWKHLAGAIGKVDGAVVKRLTVFDPQTHAVTGGLGGRTADFVIELDVPVLPGVSERVQAKQLLTDLAQLTGFEMWQTQDSTTDGSSGVRRMLIEGISRVEQ